MRGIVTRANAVQREIGHHEPLGIVSTLAHDAKAHALVPAQRGYSSLGFGLGAYKLMGSNPRAAMNSPGEYFGIASSLKESASRVTIASAFSADMQAATMPFS